MTDDDEAVAFGWQVHAALDSWTGKVDAKASIALAIEVAALGYAVSLSESGHRLSGLHHAAGFFYVVGVGVLLASLLLAALVVMPRLRRRQSTQEWRSNMIYFGHLRHWDPDKLAPALGTGQLTREQLARQLVAMSQIAWRKHALLQWSLWLLITATVLLVFLGLIR